MGHATKPTNKLKLTNHNKMPSIRRTNPSTHTHADALLTTDHKEQKPKRTIITGRAKDKHGQWGEFKVVLTVERKEKIVRSSSSRKPETVVSYHTSLADATFCADNDLRRKEKRVITIRRAERNVPRRRGTSIGKTRATTIRSSQL